MKLDGNAVLFQLTREFGEVECRTPLRSLQMDYPLLYDEAMDMNGHVVLVPDYERPRASPRLRQAICVCLGEECARFAEGEGLPTIRIGENVAFRSVYNGMQSLYVANERLDAQLDAFVNARAGYQPLLDACERTLGFASVLFDGRYHMACRSSAAPNEYALAGESVVAGALGGSLANSDPASQAGMEAEIVDLFMSSDAYRRTRTSRNVFSMPGADNLFMRNVFFQGDLVGMLAMRHHGDMLSARYVRFVLNYLAPFVEAMYGRMGVLGPAPARPGIMRDVLEGALRGSFRDARVLEKLLAEEGWDARDGYRVLHVERSFTNEGAADLEYFAERLERAWAHARCVLLDGSIYVLAAVEAAPVGKTHGLLSSDPADAHVTLLRENLAKAGESRPFRSLERIGAARMQADAAFAQGSAVDPTYWRYRFDDYALDWILAHGCIGSTAEWACHEGVYLLARHDEAHADELLATVRTFARCRYNATAAAKELGIARSTLVNRIERAAQLAGIDFDDPDERLYLAVSLKLVD